MNDWTPPTAAELRAAQREADRILQLRRRPCRRKPDTLTDAARRRAAASGRRPGHPARHPVRHVPGGVHLGRAADGPDLGGLRRARRLRRTRTLPAGLLQSFIQDGVISGVGSVLVFLPQILILFLFILLLEDLGYMARAAFLMDRIMGGAGLHGRAFIPLLSSFACAIPGIMATRVIDNRRDRLTTILVAPLMTCSARIPVYTLIIAAFIPARAGVGLRQPAGAGDVRPLRRRHRQRARRLVRGQALLLARRPDPAVHARTAGLQAAAAQERRHRPVHARHDLPRSAPAPPSSR